MIEISEISVVNDQGHHLVQNHSNVEESNLF